VRLQELFHQFSSKTSEIVGSAGAFCAAVGLIVAWATWGPFVQYSETWQLVINTSTTIITFLMVFLIQNTQNRDSQIIHLKLDELIRSQEGARNDMIDLESLSDDELKRLAEEFSTLRAKDKSLHKTLDTVGKILDFHQAKARKSKTAE
jgi:low affinity Fe/Cu permease